MAISVVQRSVTGNAAVASTIAKAMATPAAGNCVIAIGVIDAAATNLTFASDTQSKISSTAVATIPITSNLVIKVWMGYGLAASAETVTINTGFNDSALFLFEAAGLA